MYSLPDEQNKLLKQLGDIDAQERTGLIPVRSNITLLLIFFVWTVSIICVLLNLTGQRNDGLYLVIGIAIGLSLLLILAFYNFQIGYYLVCMAFLALSVYITNGSGFQNTSVLILVDSIAIFTFANLFGRNGYIVGSIIFLAKLIGIYFFFQNDKSIETIISQGINMLAIGVIPVLMLSISKVSRRAKKQEIRAEILALQNQDLVSSWGSMFDSTNAAMNAAPPPAQLQQIQPIPQIQNTPAQVFQPSMSVPISNTPVN